MPRVQCCDVLVQIPRQNAGVQDQIASHLATSADLLRSWSHRREKRQAAASPPCQFAALSASAADDSDSDTDAQPGSRADPQDLPVLKVMTAKILGSLQ